LSDDDDKLKRGRRRAPAVPPAAQDGARVRRRATASTESARAETLSTSAKTAKTKASAKKTMPRAKFAVGQIVRHRHFPFRGVVFDIDPVFNNTEEWWLSIPADRRPRKDQPFYHLLAENAETEYIAYVSEQNLLPDETGKKPRHPRVKEMFREGHDGALQPVFYRAH
jgi:heat shock protein HspQ